MNLDERFMTEALLEAKKAYDQDEVPVGCIIVKDEKIIARTFNTVERDKLAIAHAEVKAIVEANVLLGDWRLEGCTMYITKEPCAMCAGAISRARLDRLVIGLRDPERGCAGSLYNLVDDENFNHRLSITYDVLSDESRELIQDFFKIKRKAVKENE